MEFFLELLFTVALSLLFSFFLAKLLPMASAGDLEQESVLRSGSSKDVVMEEKKLKGGLMNPGLGNESRVEFVGDVVKVDEFEGESVQEKLELVDGGEEFEKEGRELEEICKDDRIGMEDEGLGEEPEVVGLEEKSDREEVEESKTASADVGEVKEEREFVRVGDLEDNLVEEKSEKIGVCEIDIESAKDEGILAKDEQVRVFGYEGNQGIEIEGVKKKGGDDDKECLFSDEEEWEGIERSEVEKLFGAAATFVGSGQSDDRFSIVGNDVQMLLYGLHKVATEGPCHEPQPMALKVSARSKWNAWQRLGNMNPEEAMEQYIALLSDRVPGWMGEIPGLEGDSKQNSPEAGVYGTQAPDLSTVLQHQPGSANERKQEELHSFVEGGYSSGDPNPVNREKQ